MPQVEQHVFCHKLLALSGVRRQKEKRRGFPRRFTKDRFLWSVAYFFPINGLSSSGCFVEPTSPTRWVPRLKLSVAERCST